MTITALERTHTAPAGLPLRPLVPVQPVPLPVAGSPRCVRALRLVPPASDPLPARLASSRRLRLTRRGRLALTFTVLALIAVMGVIAARTPGAGPARGVSAGSVVVQPGDTLWAVAVRSDPQADPRATVDRIVKLNGITGTAIRPGQRLRLPAR